MEFNETQTMAINFTKMAKEKMGDKVKDFCILDVYDDANNRAFSVEFTAYDYFPIRLNYERGRFGCCILYGERTVALSNSQQWWEEADFTVFFKELAKAAIKMVRNKPQEEQIIILKSWNEWGEGNYMEPDLQYGHGYINALAEAIKES